MLYLTQTADKTFKRGYPHLHELFVLEQSLPHLLTLTMKGVADTDEFTPGIAQTEKCSLLSVGHHRTGLVSNGQVMDIDTLRLSAFGGIADYKGIFVIGEAHINVLVLGRDFGSLLVWNVISHFDVRGVKGWEIKGEGRKCELASRQ